MFSIICRNISRLSSASDGTNVPPGLGGEQILIAIDHRDELVRGDRPEAGTVEELHETDCRRRSPATGGSVVPGDSAVATKLVEGIVRETVEERGRRRAGPRRRCRRPGGLRAAAWRAGWATGWRSGCSSMDLLRPDCSQTCRCIAHTAHTGSSRAAPMWFRAHRCGTELGACPSATDRRPHGPQRDPRGRPPHATGDARRRVRRFPDRRSRPDDAGVPGLHHFHGLGRVGPRGRAVDPGPEPPRHGHDRGAGAHGGVPHPRERPVPHRRDRRRARRAPVPGGRVLRGPAGLSAKRAVLEVRSSEAGR